MGDLPYKIDIASMMSHPEMQLIKVKIYRKNIGYDDLNSMELLMFTSLASEGKL